MRGSVDGSPVMATWDVYMCPTPPVVVVRIVGSIQNADAIDAADRVSALLEHASRGVEVCIDMREMTDYTVEAREHWSQVLKRHHPKIALLSWVTVKQTQRMVGRAVGLFTGLRTRLLDELPDEYSPSARARSAS